MAEALLVIVLLLSLCIGLSAFSGFGVQLPRLDFPLEDITGSSGPKNAHALCNKTNACCGYNSQGWLKFNCTLPTASVDSTRLKSSVPSYPPLGATTRQRTKLQEKVLPVPPNTMSPLPDVQPVPSKRQYHTGVLLTDPSDGDNYPRLVIFGGSDDQGNLLNDTWFWSFMLNQWTEVINPFGPSPRMGHTAVAYNNSLMFVFGGTIDTASGANVTNDMWVYDLTYESWTLINSPVSPPARSGHTINLVNYHGRDSFILIGGTNGILEQAFNDTWVFDISSRSWSLPSDLAGLQDTPRRSNHMAIYGYDRLFVIGGAAELPDFIFPGVLILNMVGPTFYWNRTELMFNGSYPKSLYTFQYYLPRCTLVFDPTTLTAYSYGVIQTHVSIFLSYTINSNLTKEIFPSNLTAIPTPRWGHSAVMFNGAMYIFGGAGYVKTVNNELWMFSPSSNLWLQLQPTSYNPTRQAHTTLSCGGDNLFVYGGTDGSTLFGVSSTLYYSRTNSTWRKLPVLGPSPIGTQGHTASCINSSAFIIHGGIGGPNQLNGSMIPDVWIFQAPDLRPEGVTWTNVSRRVVGTVPAPRAYHASVYFSTMKEDGYFILIGGLSAAAPTSNASSYPSGASVRTLNDIQVLSMRTMRWSTFEGPSSGVYGHTAFGTTTVEEGATSYSFYIFGGAHIDGTLSRNLIQYTYPLDGGTFSWNVLRPVNTSNTVPQPRLFHVGVTLSHSRLVIYGGASSNLTFGDLWVADLNIASASSVRWTELSLFGSKDQPQPDRFHASGALMEGALVVVGGMSSTSSNVDSISIQLGCNPGHVSVNFANVSCSICPPGTYSNNSINCTACVGHSYVSGRPAGSQQDCNMCQPNYCSNQGQCHLDPNDPYSATCTCRWPYLLSHRCEVPMFIIYVGSGAVFLCLVGLALFMCYKYIRRRIDEPHRWYMQILEQEKAFRFINYKELDDFRSIYETPAVRICGARWMGHPVVIKESQSSSFDRENLNDVIEREARLATLLSHPSILRCFGYGNVTLFGAVRWYYVMEFMERGSLDAVLSSRSNSPHESSFLFFEIRMKMISGIISGMKFMHSKKIIHSDLKSGNVFVSGDYSTKIGDFGSAREHDENWGLVGSRSMGTLLWQAPELLRCAVYSFPIDVYSFGVVLWEILTLLHDPYPDKSLAQIPEIVMLGGRPEFPRTVIESGDSRVEKLIEVSLHCMADQAERRPTFAALYQELCVTSQQLTELVSI